jgi:biotin carboxyl carrier protein
MRYYATVAEKQLIAEIESLGNHCFALTQEGQRSEVDAAAIGAGAVSMLLNHRSYAVRFEENGDEIVVYLGNQPFQIDVVSEQRFRLRGGGAKLSIQGRQVVVAPMPGKVVRVLVQLGEEVKEGQGLVVVEAMKMENELKSPKSGKVVALQAQEGNAVEKNAKLIIVE